MTFVQILQETRVIVGWGEVLSDNGDPSIIVIEIDDEQRSHLVESGAKTLNQDGTITVTPPPDPPSPPPSQAELVDQLVTEGKAALEDANITSPEGVALVAIFTQTLDGLGAIYGTQQA